MFYVPMLFSLFIPFHVLADDNFSYVENQEITISFDYGKRTGTYSGGLKDGLPHGIGKFSSTNEEGQSWDYIGEWEEGHFDGTGITIYGDGQVSLASYDTDHMCGEGAILFPDSSVYLGSLNDSGANGEGITLSISNRYEGEFQNGLRNGKGTLYYADGNRYEGEFIDNYINGEGIYYLPSGERIEGTFQENTETSLVNGSGTYFSMDNISAPCTITEGQLSIDDSTQNINASLSETELALESENQPEYNISGTINDVADTTFTVTTDKGNQYTFTLNDYQLNIGETVSFKYIGEIDSSQEIQAGTVTDLTVTAAAPAGAEYETGITYESLSRTPDDYIGEKVKFSGTVVQVLEDTSSQEIQIRLAVDDNYDTILYCGYDKNIVQSRVLEDDWITIYGTSLGLFSYQSTLGGTITIPAVYIDRIDQ